MNSLAAVYIHVELIGYQKQQADYCKRAAVNSLPDLSRMIGLSCSKGLARQKMLVLILMTMNSFWTMILTRPLAEEA